MEQLLASGLRGKDRPTRGSRIVKDALRAAHHREGALGHLACGRPSCLYQLSKAGGSCEVWLSGFGFCASGVDGLSQVLSVSSGAESLCSAFGKQPAEIQHSESKRVWISDVEASVGPPPVLRGKTSSLRAKHPSHPFAPEEISNEPEMKQQNHELPSNLSRTEMQLEDLA